MPDVLRIVIAEDNYLVREGIRQLLEASGEVQVVAAVGNATELLDAVGRLTPDAVMTDIRMPPGNHMEGVEAAHQIRRRHPEVGVVVLSQHAEEAYALELFRNGTEGLAYLLKERISDRSELLQALRSTAEGESFIDPLIVNTLVASRTRSANSPLRHLTPREREVLAHMAQGKTNPAIAEALSLSQSSIEKSINAIFTKLGLSQETRIHRRVAAVLTFLRNRDPADTVREEPDHPTY